MKRLCIATILVVTLIAMANTAFALEGDMDSFKGKLVKVVGDVHIQKAGEITFQKAKQGMELDASDRIKTGIESSADIMLTRSGKRSKIRILDEAQMSLVTLNLDKVTGDSEILLDLAIGHIIIKTDALSGKSRFEVVTPTAMTAVRGTGFEVKVVRERPVLNGDTIR